MSKRVKMTKSKRDEWLLCQEIYRGFTADHQFLSPYKATLHRRCFLCTPPSSIQLSEASPQNARLFSVIGSSLVRPLPLAWLMGNWPAVLVLHLQLILEGIWGGGFGWTVAPLQPEGLMAEGGALQAGRLRGKGLCLQLEGVTKGACSQAVQGLDSDPEGGRRRETSTSETHRILSDLWSQKLCILSIVVRQKENLATNTFLTFVTIK